VVALGVGVAAADEGVVVCEAVVPPDAAAAEVELVP
jgi:hypothetical protein